MIDALSHLNPGIFKERAVVVLIFYARLILHKSGGIRGLRKENESETYGNHCGQQKFFHEDISLLF